MESYKASFKVNKDDLEDLDIPYGGTLLFENIYKYDIGSVDLDFEHFSKKTIDNFIKVLEKGRGEASNKNDNPDFGNGGFFISIKDNIMFFDTRHFGGGTQFSVIVNLSLLRAFNKMRSYFK